MWTSGTFTELFRFMMFMDNHENSFWYFRVLLDSIVGKKAHFRWIRALKCAEVAISWNGRRQFFNYYVYISVNVIHILLVGSCSPCENGTFKNWEGPGLCIPITKWVLKRFNPLFNYLLNYILMIYSKIELGRVQMLSDCGFKPCMNRMDRNFVHWNCLWAFITVSSG